MMYEIIERAVILALSAIQSLKTNSTLPDPDDLMILVTSLSILTGMNPEGRPEVLSDPVKLELVHTDLIKVLHMARRANTELLKVHMSNLERHLSVV